MITRIRFPDLQNSDDPKIRAWANELVRSLDAYTRESIFQDIVAIVTAGTDIILSVETLPEKIYINANVSIPGGGISEASADAKYQPIGDYLTSAAAHAAFLTTAELSAHDYITSQEASALIESLAGSGLTSADVCGMLEEYVTSQEASSLYQPIGDYLTSQTASATYQPIGDYLTSQVASQTYQPLGNYLTSALTTAQACALIESYGYVSGDFVSSTYLTKTSSSAFIKPAEVSTLVCGMLSAYLTSNGASATYLTKTSSSAFIKPDEVSTLVCGMLSAYLTSNAASAKFVTTAQACALIEAYNYLVSVSNVLAGTYGTSTTIPQITVDTAGLITDIVLVTVPPAGGGGLTSADVCGMLSAYITSNNASATYLTKVSSSAFIKPAEVSTLVCGMLSAYITSNAASATYLTKVSSSAFMKPTDPGASKAWIVFNGTGTVSIGNSWNIASLTDNTTGDYTVNISTDFSNANYTVAGVTRFNSSSVSVIGIITIRGQATNPAVGSVRILTMNAAVTTFDYEYISLEMHGTL